MGVVLMRSSRITLGVLGTTVMTASLLAQTPQTAGQVKLPLSEYLALVGRVEAVSRAQAQAEARREPPVAAVVSQETAVLWGEATAEVTTTFQIEVRGTPERPVALTVTGVPSKATITPPGSAALRRGPGGPELIAPDPGRYTVKIWSVAELRTDALGAHLAFAAQTAPVASTVVELPADFAWACPGSVVAADDLRGARRVLRLALPKGANATLRVWKEVKGAEEEKALARAVVVTIVQLTTDGARRNDVVLYEVSRGSLPTFTLDLPAGLDVERIATDEGELAPDIVARHLVVQRSQRLTGVGHLVLTSSASRASTLALDPVLPEVEVRARYLAWAPNVAADAAPRPSDAFTRVDVGDLPEAIRSVSDGIKISAVWLASGNAAGAALALAVLPAAPQRATLVNQRSTTTLLTKDGTSLHRDQYTLSRTGSALELTLSPNATLWSASVNGLAVRPLLRDGTTLIPLPLGAREGTRVDTVVVEERAIPPGRSRATISPPRVTVPVLEHVWRLLLPEENQYRYVAGSLKPVPEEVLAGGGVEAGVEGGVAGGVPGAAPGGVPGEASASRPRAGESAITGRVTDGSVPLPGVTVALSSAQMPGSQIAVTDADGNYNFPFLAPGSYVVKFNLSGFSAVERLVSVDGYRTASLNAAMAQAKVAEEVTVTGSVESISSTATAASTFRAEEPSGRPAPSLPRKSKEAREQETAANYRDENANLKQGLAGGVKPVPVTVPESGKVLLLAGALPPVAVAVELDVKAKRK